MASDIDIPRYTAEELSDATLADLILGKRSFQIVAVKDISYLVEKVEAKIEKLGLRCRVYTEYRSAAVGAALVPTGITQVTGLATAIGIGVHNLVTFNPDYEIGKNQVTNTVTVKYQRDTLAAD